MHERTPLLRFSCIAGGRSPMNTSRVRRVAPPGQLPTSVSKCP